LGLSKDYSNYLNNKDSHQPLFSRATQGQYPPGSVIKPFAATAALESGAITTDTVFDGQIAENKWLPDEEGWIWPAITRVSDSGTPLKLENAIVNSDNIFFAYIALKMGEETYLNYLERIGFKTSVPFDLPVRSANLINSTTKMDRGWLAVMGYGQGELLNFATIAPSPDSNGINHHYAKVDFKGWRYFEFVEPETTEVVKYDWPDVPKKADWRRMVTDGTVDTGRKREKSSTVKVWP
jgi:hypothetical protein